MFHFSKSRADVAYFCRKQPIIKRQFHILPWVALSLACFSLSSQAENINESWNLTDTSVQRGDVLGNSNDLNSYLTAIDSDYKNKSSYIRSEYNKTITEGIRLTGWSDLILNGETISGRQTAINVSEGFVVLTASEIPSVVGDLSKAKIIVNGDVVVNGSSDAANSKILFTYFPEYSGDLTSKLEKADLFGGSKYQVTYDIEHTRPGTVVVIGNLIETTGTSSEKVDVTYQDPIIQDLGTYYQFTIAEEETSDQISSVQLNGNVSVTNSYDTSNSVWIMLTDTQEGWSWKGAATNNTVNCATCSLNGQGIFVEAYSGAVWQVDGIKSDVYEGNPKVSSISRWNSHGNSVIDLTQTKEQLVLNINQLTGSGTVIKEKVDPNSVAGVNQTDLVLLGGRSYGSHTVELHSTGAKEMEITTGRIPYLKVLLPCAIQDSSSASLIYEGAVKGSLSLIGYDEALGGGFDLNSQERSDGKGKTATIQLQGDRIYTFKEEYLNEKVVVTNGKITPVTNWMENDFTVTEKFPELVINYGNVTNHLDIGNRKYTILDPVLEPDGSVVFYVQMDSVLDANGDPVPTTDLPFEELSTGTELVTTLAGDGTIYSAWMADLTDLRKRLGEVRYGAQDGLWAKAIAQKDRISGITGADFKEKLYGIQIGLDHIVTQNEDRMWLLGGNFKYTTVDQKVQAMTYGHGDMRAYGAFFYATYANYKGCYTDLVLSIDHYKQKMTAEQLDASYVHGKYNTWGWGASVEVGKMFSSTQDDEGWGPWYNHWFIEPQAQLAYYWVKGKHFSLDNDLDVRQNNGNSLIGRLGVVIGKKFNYGENRKEVDKRYSQFYVKGGIKHEFLGKQTIYVNGDKFSDKLRGTRVYYGAGVDWNLTDQLRVYAQVERENGHKYRKDYEVSVGLKWQF